MKYIIDTHTFLWYVNGSSELSQRAKSIIDDEKNEVFISIVSLCEISIKASLGKLTINGSYDSVIDDVILNDFKILSIIFEHTVIQNNLYFHHRDPFDRMIISQALFEAIDIISIDTTLDQYFRNTERKRIW